MLVLFRGARNFDVCRKVPVQNILDSLQQILMQMEPIRDLHGFGKSVIDRRGISTRAVTGNGFDVLILL